MVFIKKWQIVLPGLLLLLFSACKSAKPDTISLESKVQSVIPSVGSSYYNQDKTYLLVIEQPGVNEFLKFAVVNVNTLEIIMEKKFRPGYVKWADNTTLELLDVPGIIETNKKIEDYKQYVSISKPQKQ